MKENSSIIKVVTSDKSDRSDKKMKCPYRTDKVTYHVTLSNGIYESHQRTDFVDCYFDECFFFRDGCCEKALSDVGRNVNYK